MEKIVYVSLEHKCSTDDLDILSPKQLDKLMEEKKLSIVKEEDEKVTHPETKKQVTVKRYLLSDEKERALTVKDDEEQPKKRGILSRIFGRNDLTEAKQDEEEDERGVAVRDSGSFLGSGSDFSQLIEASGASVAKSCSPAMAFTMGTDAAAMDKLAEDCPFKRGSRPYEEWMKGFKANGGDAPVIDPVADKEAYDLGVRSGKIKDKDLEVSCPYPPKSRLYRKWVEGFKDGGGTFIEEESEEIPQQPKLGVDNGMV